MHASDRSEQALARVEYTLSFASDLETIAAFHAAGGFADRYDQLIDELADVAVPNLQRHPGMGRPFPTQAVDSIEAARVLERIEKRLGRLTGDCALREYVLRDCLLLYLARHGRSTRASVQLLAIRHQKQMSFDLAT